MGEPAEEVRGASVLLSLGTAVIVIALHNTQLFAGDSYSPGTDAVCCRRKHPPPTSLPCGPPHTFALLDSLQYQESASPLCLFLALHI